MAQRVVILISLAFYLRVLLPPSRRQIAEVVVEQEGRPFTIRHHIRPSRRAPRSPPMQEVRETISPS